MLVYLIRHAEAADLLPDAARPLTARGRHQVARLAHFLKRSNAFKPAEVWHSPLVRARETAHHLLAEMELAVPLREEPGITPDDDPQVIARRLARHHRMVEPLVADRVDVALRAEGHLVELALGALIDDRALVAREGRAVLVAFEEILADLRPYALQHEAEIGENGVVAP